MFFDMKSLISTKSRVHLLTESAWCLDIEQINIIIPNIFRDDINSVSNKKVKWAWEYSTVIIEMLNNEYRMNLLLFNKHSGIQDLNLKREVNSKISKWCIYLHTIVNFIIVASQNVNVCSFKEKIVA